MEFAIQDFIDFLLLRGGTQLFPDEDDTSLKRVSSWLRDGHWWVCGRRGIDLAVSDPFELLSRLISPFKNCPNGL